MARPLRYLVEHGYEGGIYPVNPNYDELVGQRCYPTLADVPGPVDLVLVLVAAERVEDAIRQAAAVGATAAVVYASGFAEVGPEGVALQQRLTAVARETGVRVLGPNCQGFLYAPTGVVATFTAAADRPLAHDSGVAYVGQSGAVGGSVLDLATDMGLGLAAWASTGNQADLDLVEVSLELLEDPAVRVLMLYVEAADDGVAFAALARRARVMGKHLVVLRSGRSSAGRRAVASHTGSMLGDDVAFVLTAEEHGVVLVHDIDELLAVAAVAGHRQAVGGTAGRRRHHLRRRRQPGRRPVRGPRPGDARALRGDPGPAAPADPRVRRAGQSGRRHRPAVQPRRPRVRRRLPDGRRRPVGRRGRRLRDDGRGRRGGPAGRGPRGHGRQAAGAAAGRLDRRPGAHHGGAGGLPRGRHPHLRLGGRRRPVRGAHGTAPAAGSRAGAAAGAGGAGREDPGTARRRRSSTGRRCCAPSASRSPPRRW